MNQIRARILQIFLLASVTVASATMALAQSFTMGGTWVGRYDYSDGKTSVEFVLELDVAGRRCLGRIEEPNTFGDKSAKSLSANVACVSSGVGPGKAFVFHKQYDGTGGVSHGVEYSGVVSENGRTVTGRWRIGNNTGTFSMNRKTGS